MAPINLDRFEMVVKGTTKEDTLKESVDALTDAAKKITEAVEAFNTKKEPLPEEEPAADTETGSDDKGIPGKD